MKYEDALEGLLRELCHRCAKKGWKRQHVTLYCDMTNGDPETTFFRVAAYMSNGNDSLITNAEKKIDGSAYSLKEAMKRLADRIEEYDGE